MAEIPVRIVFRHADWARVREAIAQAACPEVAKDGCFVAAHPDLKKWRLSVRQIIDLGDFFRAADLPQPAYCYIPARADPSSTPPVS